MHRILERQIKKTLGTKPISSELEALLELVDVSYRHFDEDRALTERSLEITSRELLEKNYQLQEELENLKKSAEHISELDDTKRAMLNVLEDIQEEKRLVSLSAKELNKFKVALDSISDHVIITNASGIVLYANAAVEKVTGFTIQEILGKKAGTRELWGGNMEQEFYTKLWHTIKISKKPFLGTMTNKRKDGTIYQALSSISPILNHAGEAEFFVGIERDVTKEKEVDRMKTDFISLASHQLRTPLSAMKWFCEMLMGGDAGSLNASQLEMVSNINQSNERMIALVNSLLNISRIESGRIIIDPHSEDLTNLLNSVVTELQSKILLKNLHLIIKTTPQLPKISIDAKLVCQVYSNLLSNAIKYTPEGGNITVSIYVDGQFAVSQITDDGLGIPKNEQNRLFHRFFRATNVVKVETDGTGLGLYLTKAIVDSSGGQIWYESLEGKGTTFWFSLPLGGTKAKKGEVTINS